TELLESAGFEVVLPARQVCCGRPLYDYGFLGLAKRLLLDVVATLRDDIRAGVPVVVLEPSCAAVFRGEMLNLLPQDEDAKRLAPQVRLFAEFVGEHRDRFAIPKIDRRLLYHWHCHHKAIFGTDADRALLADIATAVDTPDSGCCGMAGSFGFEADHCEIAVKIGERVLLPAVRSADPATLIVADGFSCREQIAQGTDRRAIHPAELLWFVHRGANAIAHDRPERA